mgnify:CR=1 FL=1
MVDLPVEHVPHSDFPEIRAGNLGVLATQDKAYVRAAQKLRYKIFFGELGGVSHNPDVVAQQRDFDKFDEHCDHLIVLDHDKETIEEQVVATYRLMRRKGMEAVGRFYTEGEFDVSGLKAYDGDIMELGRSCVHEDYRGRAAMQLLWRGIGEYVASHKVKYMFGCASFSGNDIEEYKLPLSYLYHYHLTPEVVRPKAVAAHYKSTNLMAKDDIDVKAARAALPALIKGYLRVNGTIGDGAFIDNECNSIDVSIVVETDMVTDKYVKRYKTAG